MSSLNTSQKPLKTWKQPNNFGHWKREIFFSFSEPLHVKQVFHKYFWCTDIIHFVNTLSLFCPLQNMWVAQKVTINVIFLRYSIYNLNTIWYDINMIWLYWCEINTIDMSCSYIINLFFNARYSNFFIPSEKIFWLVVLSVYFITTSKPPLKASFIGPSRGCCEIRRRSISIWGCVIIKKRTAGIFKNFSLSHHKNLMTRCSSTVQAAKCAANSYMAQFWLRKHAFNWAMSTPSLWTYLPWVGVWNAMSVHFMKYYQYATTVCCYFYVFSYRTIELVLYITVWCIMITVWCIMK